MSHQAKRIVVRLLQAMYLEQRDGEFVLNPNKELSGADLIQQIEEILLQEAPELVPTRVTPVIPAEMFPFQDIDPEPATSAIEALKLVLLECSDGVDTYDANTPRAAAIRAARKAYEEVSGGQS